MTNMPQLIIYKNSKPYKEFQFSNVITIGRNRTNDVVLKSQEVSDFHASIIQDADDKYILFDQSSRNFTWVGGKRIQNYPLSHGTSFEIVNYLFTFTEDSEVGSTEQKVRLSRKIPIAEKVERDARTVFILAKKINDEPMAYRDPRKRLSLILALSSEIVSIPDYHELMEKVLDISMEMMEAERGFLALKNDKEELIYSCLKGFNTDSGNLRVSETMIQKVMKQGRSITHVGVRE